MTASKSPKVRTTSDALMEKTVMYRTSIPTSYAALIEAMVLQCSHCSIPYFLVFNCNDKVFAHGVGGLNAMVPQVMAPSLWQPNQRIYFLR